MDKKFLQKVEFNSLSKMFALLMMAMIFIVGSPVLTAQSPCLKENPPMTYIAEMVDKNCVPEYEGDECSWCLDGYDEYCPTKLVSIGTSNSRLVGTIVEEGDLIRIDVIGIGEMTIDNVVFSIYYNSDKYILCETDGTPLGYGFGYLKEGNLDGNLVYGLANVVEIKPALLNVDPPFYVAMEQTWHLGPGECPGERPGCQEHLWVEGWAAVAIGLTNISEDSPPYVGPEEGVIVPLFSFYLKKLPGNTASPIADDFGMGVFDKAPYTTLFWQHALVLTYFYVGTEYEQEGIDWEQIECLFLLRSAAEVETVGVDEYANYVDLTGQIKRPFDPTNVLDHIDFPDYINAELYDDGRLEWDEIIKYGFIYTGDPDGENIELFFDPYSNELKMKSGITETSCVLDFVGALETIAGGTYGANDRYKGTFTCGGINFYILLRAESEDTLDDVKDPDFTFRVDIDNDGLEYDVTYYGWAFATYFFETSNEYSLVGEQIEFMLREEEEECDLAITAVQVISHPTCGEDDGEVKLFITGGSGDYEVSKDYG
ncbi:MAG: hypothetical protein FWF09_01195, partial [Bacteroidales bacterium]|nr:hypothetical protein [Bacteroidales bacterium]